MILSWPYAAKDFHTAMSSLTSKLGQFISFEGIDGSGKTSCAQWFAKQIGAHYTYEPGGTLEGQRIRDIIFTKHTHGVSDVLLFSSSRAILIENVIKPLTQDGIHVVCDRFADSTVAYQHYGLGLSLVVIQTLNAISCQGLVPDITFLLDVDPQIALTRMTGNSQKFERLDILTKARQGYLALAQNNPDRIVVIDANQSLSDVQHTILELFASRQ